MRQHRCYLPLAVVLTEAYLANGLLQWVFEYIGLITKVNKCQNERIARVLKTTAPLLYSTCTCVV